MSKGAQLFFINSQLIYFWQFFDIVIAVKSKLWELNSNRVDSFVAFFCEFNQETESI